MTIRAVVNEDFDAWFPLWDKYNQFYNRTVSAEVTESTWKRFLAREVPVHALVAVDGDRLLSFVHYLFHYHTALIEPSCYLQDLFTLESERGRGVGQHLIEAVSERAKQSGSGMIYWQTHESNTTARRLYDKIGKNSGFIVYKK